MTSWRASGKVQRAMVCVVAGAWLVSACGCQALVKKFTRKSKNQGPQEELVIQPQEYKVTATTEELYRKYFLYAGSWLDEAQEALTPNGNRKKQLATLDEAMKDLMQCRAMLKEEPGKKLDGYMAKLQKVRDSVDSDINGRELSMQRYDLERVRRYILRDFSWSKVKNSVQEGQK